MKILAVESSAKAASAAIVESGRIIAQSYSDAGLTHSRTLMPMVDAVCRDAEIAVSDIDVFAVSHGPGSFTGIRIGVAAVKGMADALGKPCIGLSTLEVIAWSLSGFNCTAACVMDARCSQVYTALFECKNGEVNRLSNDEAIAIDELMTRLEKTDGDIYFVGDGAELCFARCALENAHLAPAHIRNQTAGCAGLCAEKHLLTRPPVDAAALIPVYLRVPQAERELKKRNALRKD